MGRVRVEVVWARPDGHRAVTLELPAGSTVEDSLRAAGIAPADDAAFAIHGERASGTAPLRDGDRVELLRPLAIQPNDARRRRALKHRGKGSRAG